MSEMSLRQIRGEDDPVDGREWCACGEDTYDPEKYTHCYSCRQDLAERDDAD